MRGEAFLRRRVAFNARELSGAFGDIGTDLPLVLGLVAINGLDAASVFTLFGAFQVHPARAGGSPASSGGSAIGRGPEARGLPQLDPDRAAM